MSFGSGSALGLMILVLLTLGTACGSPARDLSHVTHVWGQTRRSQIPAASNHTCNASASDARMTARLVSLAERIARANPETFTGDIQPSRICLTIDGRESAPLAVSVPERRHITFSLKLLELASNDDQLAAVLSHELAHITLQHQGFGEFPARMIDDPTFVDLRTQSQKIQQQIIALALAKADPSQIFVLNEQFSALLKSMNQRVDAVYGEQHAHINWFEQEADEVGAEFFLRSGFSKDSFSEILWKTRSGESMDRDSCEQMIRTAEMSQNASAERPPRGKNTHPTTCWRDYHLRVDEWTHAHASEIGTLNLK